MNISQQAMQDKVHKLKEALQKQGKIEEHMILPK
jgi:hypothetical protein